MLIGSGIQAVQCIKSIKSINNNSNNEFVIECLGEAFCYVSFWFFNKYKKNILSFLNSSHQITVRGPVPLGMDDCKFLCFLCFFSSVKVAKFFL